MHMKKWTAAAIGAVLAVSAAGAAVAHHSFATEFDRNKPIRLEGKVVKFEWVNPHSWIHLRVADGTTWRVEGGAPSALLRRGWKTDPAIAFNKNQDIVHRVVGPPGIVLIGEGNPNRLRSLLANERRKHERVVSEVPIHEVIVGDPSKVPGAVPIPKLSRHVQKLGRNIKGAQMTDVLSRLRALDANRSNIPLPKGPMPTNLKGARQNMRGR